MTNQLETQTTLSTSDTWTPSKQAAASQLKILRLLELGENEKGRFARVEFSDESSRPLYLLTIADAWHSIFNSLDFNSRWMIRGHFNSRLPEIRLPDGSRKRYRYATFATEVTSARGRHISSSYFDLSAYQGVAAEQAGVSVARELLELYATGNCQSISLAQMFDDLALAHSGHARHSRRAFLDAIDGLLRFAARNANFHEYLDNQSARYAADEKWLADAAVKEKAAFVERMKASRLAKRQAKSGCSDGDQLKAETVG